MKKLISVLLVAVMLCGCFACFTSCGEKKYTVGICQLVQHEALDAATQGFIDALTAELGADNVEFLNENASGDVNQCTTIVGNFVSKNVDLILANATPALTAAYNATQTIPILGTSITEYGTALGISNFNGTVGGNVSGTSDLADMATQAQMMKELFPDATTVGILYCSAEANSVYQVQVMTTELTKLGFTVTPYSFSDSNDVTAVTVNAAANSDVLYIPTDNTAASCAATIDSAMTGANRKPIFAGEEGVCKNCGVATLTISYYDLGVTTGKMAAKILKGEADISTMAVEYAPATKKYNATFANEYDITIPQDYTAITTD